MANHLHDQRARIAIRETLEAYFSSVDRRDWQAYGDCFAHDATVQFGHETPEIVVGREKIVKRAANRLNRPVSNHLLSNAHILVEGMHADAVTHAIAHLALSRDGADTIVVRGIVYHDELVQSGAGLWQISNRRHEPLWQYQAPAVALGYQ